MALSAILRTIVLGGGSRSSILAAASSATRDRIAAIEAADGLRLENAVLAAIIPYANWRIPLGGACVLHSAARTLAGAMVPLVGPTPTPVDFTAAAYNRRRLLSNGSTQYVNSNYGNTSDAQDSQHMFTYASGGNYGAGTVAVMGLMSPAAGSSILTTGSRSRAETTDGVVSFSGRSGFAGISREAPGSYARILPPETTESYPARASALPGAGSLFVFARNNNGSPSNPGAHPLCLYSFGADIDLNEARTRCVAYEAALIAAGL